MANTATKSPAPRKRRRAAAPRQSREVIQQQALTNALADRSMVNYETIIEGFMEKGIELDDITPRVNVFTYNAWRALGRQVRKGESGVKVVTMIPLTQRAEDGQEAAPLTDESGKPRMKAKNVTVFHVSQTDPIEVTSADQA